MKAVFIYKEKFRIIINSQLYLEKPRVENAFIIYGDKL